MKPRLTIWWLHPAAVFGLLCGMLIVVATLIPEGAYLRLWFTPKFLTNETNLLLFGFLAVFVIAALVSGMRLRYWVGPKDTGQEEDLSASTLLVLYRVAVGLTLLGYVVWGAIAISKGLNWAVLLDIAHGKPDVLYSVRATYLVSVPGITTCTQFGVAAAVLGALVAARSGWKKVWKSLSILFVLVLLRVILNTERLALIEVGIPMLVIVITQVLGPLAHRRRSIRLATSAAPIAAFPLLFVLFAGFEYFRSWVYYSGGPFTFWEFAASRLTGYYVTAINNGAYLVTRLQAPLGLPLFTMNFLWRLPIGQGLVESLFPTSSLTTTYFDILDSGANAEFSNGGGLFAPALDFGSLGAVAYWLAAGLLFGRMYALFKRGSSWGLCLYPIVFLGLLDVPRGLYWSNGRAVPPIAFLALSAYLLMVQQKRQRDRTSPTVC